MGSAGEKRAGSCQLLGDVQYYDANYKGRVYIQRKEGPEEAQFTANIRSPIKELIEKTEQELPMK